MIERRSKPLYRSDFTRRPDGELEAAKNLMEKVAKDYVKDRITETGAKRFAKKMRDHVTNDMKENPLNSDYLRDIVKEVKTKEDLFTNKCTNLNLPPERQFVFEHYIDREDIQFFPNQINNLKLVYNNMMKIFDYYVKTGKLEKNEYSCHIIIIRGLMSSDDCFNKFGDSKNPHFYGKAIDFIFDKIDCDTIFNDIQDGKINLDKNCEVILLNDSIHLAYYSDRQSIRLENHKKEGIY